MFQQLPESKAILHPPVGGTLASTIAHAALVGGLVWVTAGERQRPVVSLEPRARFIPVSTPHVAPAAPAAPVRPAGLPVAAASQSVATPLAIVIDIQTGLPPIDLNGAGADVTDFHARGVPGTHPDGVPGATSAGAGAVALREHEVDKPVLLAPGMSAPVYPESLRAAGVSGSVLVEFVVDTMGRVESGSERVVQSGHAHFTAAVRAVLPKYRFLPAEAQGNRVRQLVRMPFRFDLGQ